MLLRTLITFALLLLTSPAWATVYHVETTGNDTTGTGSVAAPWLTIQKSVAAGTPVVAGDTIEVGNGTYTSTTSQRMVVISGSSPSGTSANPITIKSATPFGATINVPNQIAGINCNVVSCSIVGILLNKPYYIIEGFQCTRTGSYFGTFAGVGCIYIDSGGDNAIVRRNHFHDIARTVCNNGTIGNYGVYLDFPSNVTIEYNRFNAIGRLRNGESGCSTNTFQHDHGVYANGTTDLTIYRNIFYDVNRGMPINIKAYAGATTRLKVFQNVLSGKTPTADGKPDGQIAITNTLNDGQFKNNIFHDVNSATDGYVFWDTSNAVFTNLVIDHNLSDSTSGSLLHAINFPTSGVTNTNNLLNTNPGFVNAAARDYTLASGSAAINAGVALAGYSFNSTAPDIGRHERVGFGSATINQALMDVTAAQNITANSPINPTSAGWSVACSGGANCGTPVVAAASLLTGTSNVVRLVLTGLGGTGVSEVGQTWTVTYNDVTGATVDADGQELSSFTTQPVTNNSGVAPPADPGTPFVNLQLNDAITGTTPTTAQDSSANNKDATLNNGTTYVPGKFGGADGALKFADGTTQTATIVYGSGIDPTSQSLTICADVLPDPGLESSTRIFYAASLGAGQRHYMAWDDGTWSIGIQNSPSAVNTEFPVVPGRSFVCLVENSATDTAQLFVNAVAGTGPQSLKAYTSHTLASNVQLGALPTASGGGVTIGQLKIYQAALTPAEILDLYNAWEPPSPPQGCTVAQVGSLAYKLRKDTGGLLDLHGALNATTVNVVAPGALMISTQTDFTIADCAALAEEWRYSCALCLSAGTWLAVPDTVGPDCIGFYGATTDPDILQTAPTARLSGALTFIPGQAQFTMAQTPVVDPTLNSSFVNRGAFKFDTCASGKTYQIRKQTQQGEAFSSYFPANGIGVVAIPMTSAGGL